MKIDFPYPNYRGIESLTIPSANLMGIFEPQNAEDLGIESSEESIICSGLLKPLGAPPLYEILDENSSVLILIDDNTRVTPLKRLLPHVIHEVQRAGVP